MDDYLFCKSSLLFSENALTVIFVTVLLLGYNCESQACRQIFHSDSFPEHHFVVSTMTV